MAKTNIRPAGEIVQAALIDRSAFLRDLIERVLQEMLEAEITDHIGADRYERTSDRRGQRNGNKPRTIITRVGTLNLMVPQDRDGTFSSEIFARYKRNEKALVLSLMEMYVQGVSTRKVSEITEALCGTTFSKSLVSHLCSQLDHELAAWRERPLTSSAYPYIFVDARYENVRIGGQVVSQGVLIATGIRSDGKREVLAVSVGDTESEATYSELFSGLKERGLSGVRLMVSDDHKGLKKALKRHFQGASWQRCQVHFLRNLTGMVGKNHRKALASGLKEVFQVPDISRAKDVAQALVRTWERTHPKVAQHIDEHIEECLSHLHFPASHHVRIRTTNGIERLNQEIKRRTRIIRIFPNREACLRIVSSLCIERSEEWVSGKIYLNMEGLLELLCTDDRKERELKAAQ